MAHHCDLLLSVFPEDPMRGTWVGRTPLKSECLILSVCYLLPLSSQHHFSVHARFLLLLAWTFLEYNFQLFSINLAAFHPTFDVCLLNVQKPGILSVSLCHGIRKTTKQVKWWTYTHIHATSRHHAHQPKGVISGILVACLAKST